MVKYNGKGLALIIKNIIEKDFTDPEYFYSQFKVNINRKIKSLSSKDLTDSELKDRGLFIAQDIIRSFSQIKLNFIEYKISNEIKNKAILAGIELSDEMPYFIKSAKERIKELIDSQYMKAKKKPSKKKGK